MVCDPVLTKGTIVRNRIAHASLDGLYPKTTK